MLLSLQFIYKFQDLTIALQQKIQQYACEHASILGIDLDGDLIKLAEDKLKDCDKKITFQQANIMLEEGRSCIADYLHNNAIAQFDVSFCFSVTMWIHLNHGDEGLKEFLQYLCSVSKLLVIEPQEWKSYNAANRRLRRNNVQEFPKLGELKMRYNVAEEIERYLIEDCKASLVQKSAKTHWGRTVLILKCS